MSNTNGMTYAEFAATLVAANVAGGISAQRVKRAEILATFGPKVEVNPYGGRYAIMPMGWIFACGRECFSDVGYQPAR